MTGVQTCALPIFVKERTASGNWPVYHTSLGKDAYLILNLTNGSGSSTSYWGTGGVTSSVFGTSTTAGASNGTNRPIVAYCWTAIPGYSAFGSYTGNGSTDGPFIYTGFRPKWILFKNTSALTNWLLIDGVRNPYNAVDAHLHPNITNAEAIGSPAWADFTANGFKLRSSYGETNTSSQTYVYAAFAEIPFKYARAR